MSYSQPGNPADRFDTIPSLSRINPNHAIAIGALLAVGATGVVSEATGFTNFTPVGQEARVQQIDSHLENQSFDRKLEGWFYNQFADSATIYKSSQLETSYRSPEFTLPKDDSNLFPDVRLSESRFVTVGTVKVLIPLRATWNIDNRQVSLGIEAVLNNPIMRQEIRIALERGDTEFTWKNTAGDQMLIKFVRVALDTNSDAVAGAANQATIYGTDALVPVLRALNGIPVAQKSK
jgi:hypothetical protein